MMKNKKEVIYMVTYVDDDKRKHLSFIKGFSNVRFLEDRFENVTFERTETYVRSDNLCEC